MKYLRLALILFLLGLILIMLSALTGEGKIIIVFFIIPVFYARGIFGVLGALFIILSLIFVMFELTKIELSFGEVVEEEPRVAKTSIETKSGAGGIVLLGPIPIVFGSNKSILIITLAASILIMALLLLILFLY